MRKEFTLNLTYSLVFLKGQNKKSKYKSLDSSQLPSSSTSFLSMSTSLLRESPPQKSAGVRDQIR